LKGKIHKFVEIGRVWTNICNVTWVSANVRLVSFWLKSVEHRNNNKNRFGSIFRDQCCEGLQ